MIKNNKENFNYTLCGSPIYDKITRNNYPYREGYCQVEPSKYLHANEADRKSLWGYCDDSNKIYPGVSDRHPLFEVETTIVENHRCGISNDSQTLICTGYVPRTPSRYEMEYNATGFHLVRYLGGAYRQPIKKIIQRQRTVEFDRFGNPKLQGNNKT